MLSAVIDQETESNGYDESDVEHLGADGGAETERRVEVGQSAE